MRRFARVQALPLPTPATLLAVVTSGLLLVVVLVLIVPLLGAT